MVTKPLLAMLVYKCVRFILVYSTNTQGDKNYCGGTCAGLSAVPGFAVSILNLAVDQDYWQFGQVWLLEAYAVLAVLAVEYSCIILT